MGGKARWRKLKRVVGPLPQGASKQRFKKERTKIRDAKRRRMAEEEEDDEEEARPMQGHEDKKEGAEEDEAAAAANKKDGVRNLEASSGLSDDSQSADEAKDEGRGLDGEGKAPSTTTATHKDAKQEANGIDDLVELQKPGVVATDLDKDFDSPIVEYLYDPLSETTLEEELKKAREDISDFPILEEVNSKVYSLHSSLKKTSSLKNGQGGDKPWHTDAEAVGNSEKSVKFFISDDESDSDTAIFVDACQHTMGGDEDGHIMDEDSGNPGVIDGEAEPAMELVLDSGDIELVIGDLGDDPNVTDTETPNPLSEIFAKESSVATQTTPMQEADATGNPLVTDSTIQANMPGKQNDLDTISKSSTNDSTDADSASRTSASDQIDADSVSRTSASDADAASRTSAAGSLEPDAAKKNVTDSSGDPNALSTPSGTESSDSDSASKVSAVPQDIMTTSFTEISKVDSPVGYMPSPTGSSPTIKAQNAPKIFLDAATTTSASESGDVDAFSKTSASECEGDGTSRTSVSESGDTDRTSRTSVSDSDADVTSKASVSEYSTTDGTSRTSASETGETDDTSRTSAGDTLEHTSKSSVSESTEFDTESFSSTTDLSTPKDEATFSLDGLAKAGPEEQPEMDEGIPEVPLISPGDKKETEEVFMDLDHDGDVRLVDVEEATTPVNKVVKDADAESVFFSLYPEYQPGEGEDVQEDQAKTPTGNPKFLCFRGKRQEQGESQEDIYMAMEKSEAKGGRSKGTVRGKINKIQQRLSQQKKSEGENKNVSEPEGSSSRQSSGSSIDEQREPTSGTSDEDQKAKEESKRSDSELSSHAAGGWPVPDVLDSTSSTASDGNAKEIQPTADNQDDLVCAPGRPGGEVTEPMEATAEAAKDNAPPADQAEAAGATETGQEALELENKTNASVKDRKTLVGKAREWIKGVTRMGSKKEDAAPDKANNGKPELLNGAETTKDEVKNPEPKLEDKDDTSSKESSVTSETRISDDEKGRRSETNSTVKSDSNDNENTKETTPEETDEEKPSATSEEVSAESQEEVSVTPVNTKEPNPDLESPKLETVNVVVAKEEEEAEVPEAVNKAENSDLKANEEEKPDEEEKADEGALVDEEVKADEEVMADEVGKAEEEEKPDEVINAEVAAEPETTPETVVNAGGLEVVEELQTPLEENVGVENGEEVTEVNTPPDGLTKPDEEEVVPPSAEPELISENTLPLKETPEETVDSVDKIEAEEEITGVMNTVNGVGEKPENGPGGEEGEVVFTETKREEIAEGNPSVGDKPNIDTAPRENAEEAPKGTKDKVRRHRKTREKSKSPSVYKEAGEKDRSPRVSRKEKEGKGLSKKRKHRRRTKSQEEPEVQTTVFQATEITQEGEKEPAPVICPPEEGEKGEVPVRDDSRQIEPAVTEGAIQPDSPEKILPAEEDMTQEKTLEPEAVITEGKELDVAERDVPVKEEVLPEQDVTEKEEEPIPEQDLIGKEEEALPEQDVTEKEEALPEQDVPEKEEALPEQDAIQKEEEALPEQDVMEKVEEALPEKDVTEKEAALPEQDVVEKEEEALPEKDVTEKEELALPEQDVTEKEEEALPEKDITKKEEVLPDQDVKEKEEEALPEKDITEKEEAPPKEVTEKKEEALPEQEVNVKKEKAVTEHDVSVQTEEVPAAAQVPQPDSRTSSLRRRRSAKSSKDKFSDEFWKEKLGSGHKRHSRHSEESKSFGSGEYAGLDYESPSRTKKGKSSESKHRSRDKERKDKTSKSAEAGQEVQQRTEAESAATVPAEGDAGDVTTFPAAAATWSPRVGRKERRSSRRSGERKRDKKSSDKSATAKTGDKVARKTSEAAAATPTPKVEPSVADSLLKEGPVTSPTQESAYPGSDTVVLEIKFPEGISKPRSPSPQIYTWPRGPSAAEGASVPFSTVSDEGRLQIEIPPPASADSSTVLLEIKFPEGISMPPSPIPEQYTWPKKPEDEKPSEPLLTVLDKAEVPEEFPKVESPVSVGQDITAEPALLVAPSVTVQHEELVSRPLFSPTFTLRYPEGVSQPLSPTKPLSIDSSSVLLEIKFPEGISMPRSPVPQKYTCPKKPSADEEAPEPLPSVADEAKVQVEIPKTEAPVSKAEDVVSEPALLVAPSFTLQPEEGVSRPLPSPTLTLRYPEGVSQPLSPPRPLSLESGSFLLEIKFPEGISMPRSPVPQKYTCPKKPSTEEGVSEPLLTVSEEVKAETEIPKIGTPVSQIQDVPPEPALLTPPSIAVESQEGISRPLLSPTLTLRYPEGVSQPMSPPRPLSLESGSILLEIKFPEGISMPRSPVPQKYTCPKKPSTDGASEPLLSVPGEAEVPAEIAEAPVPQPQDVPSEPALLVPPSVTLQSEEGVPKPLPFPTLTLKYPEGISQPLSPTKPLSIDSGSILLEIKFPEGISMPRSPVPQAYTCPKKPAAAEEASESLLSVSEEPKVAIGSPVPKSQDITSAPTLLLAPSSALQPGDGFSRPLLSPTLTWRYPEGVSHPLSPPRPVSLESGSFLLEIKFPEGISMPRSPVPQKYTCPKKPSAGESVPEPLLTVSDEAQAKSEIPKTETPVSQSQDLVSEPASLPVAIQEEEISKPVPQALKVKQPEAPSTQPSAPEETSQLPSQTQETPKPPEETPKPRPPKKKKTRPRVIIPKVGSPTSQVPKGPSDLPQPTSPPTTPKSSDGISKPTSSSPKVITSPVSPTKKASSPLQKSVKLGSPSPKTASSTSEPTTPYEEPATAIPKTPEPKETRSSPVKQESSEAIHSPKLEPSQQTRSTPQTLPFSKQSKDPPESPSGEPKLESPSLQTPVTPETPSKPASHKSSSRSKTEKVLSPTSPSSATAVPLATTEETTDATLASTVTKAHKVKKSLLSAIEKITQECPKPTQEVKSPGDCSKSTTPAPESPVRSPEQCPKAVKPALKPKPSSTPPPTEKSATEDTGSPPKDASKSPVTYYKLKVEYTHKSAEVPRSPTEESKLPDDSEPSPVVEDFQLPSGLKPSADLPPIVEDLKPPAEELTPPSDDLEPPAEDLVPPAKDLESQAEDLVPPAKDLESQAEDLVPPAKDLESQAEDLVPPSKDLESQAEDLVPPTKDLESQAGDLVPLAEVHEPLTEVQEPPAEVHEPPPEIQEPPAEVQKPTEKDLELPAEIQEPQVDRGPPAEDLKPLAEVLEPPAEVQEPPPAKDLEPLVEDLEPQVPPQPLLEESVTLEDFKTPPEDLKAIKPSATQKLKPPEALAVVTSVMTKVKSTESLKRVSSGKLESTPSKISLPAPKTGSPTLKVASPTPKVTSPTSKIVSSTPKAIPKTCVSKATPPAPKLISPSPKMATSTTKLMSSPHKLTSTSRKITSPMRTVGSPTPKTESLETKVSSLPLTPTQISDAQLLKMVRSSLPDSVLQSQQESYKSSVSHIHSTSSDVPKMPSSSPKPSRSPVRRTLETEQPGSMPMAGVRMSTPASKTRRSEVPDADVSLQDRDIQTTDAADALCPLQEDLRPPHETHVSTHEIRLSPHETRLTPHIHSCYPHEGSPPSKEGSQSPGTDPAGRRIRRKKRR